MEAAPKKGGLKELLGIYASLSKARLGSLVVLSTMVGFYMTPLPFDFVKFLWTSTGTALAVASANTFNQVIEVSNDARMQRTFKRVLPSKRITITHAKIFGASCGAVGVLMLLWQANALASGLALTNIFLYTLVYTPLKRIHPINTWVGSIVGAIPPMIGWAALTGMLGCLLHFLPCMTLLRWVRTWGMGSRCSSVRVATPSLSFTVLGTAKRLWWSRLQDVGQLTS